MPALGSTEYMPHHCSPVEYDQAHPGFQTAMTLLVLSVSGGKASQVLSSQWCSDPRVWEGHEGTALLGQNPSSEPSTTNSPLRR